MKLTPKEREQVIEAATRIDREEENCIFSCNELSDALAGKFQQFYGNPESCDYGIHGGGWKTGFNPEAREAREIRVLWLLLFAEVCS